MAYAENESVQSHIPRIQQAMSELLGSMMLQWLPRLDAGDIESPIEAIFLLWWEAIARVTRLHEQFAIVTQVGLAPIEGRSYRADFAFDMVDRRLSLDGSKHGVSFPMVLIELDGHDFHERTKEQVAHRNQRDRDLQSVNITVLHFSGSEIHRDPYAVMVDVVSCLSGKLDQFREALRVAQKATGA